MPWKGRDSRYVPKKDLKFVCIVISKKEIFSGSARGATAIADPNKGPIRRGLVPGRGGGAFVKVQETRRPAHTVEKFSVLNNGVPSIGEAHSCFVKKLKL